MAKAEGVSFCDRANIHTKKCNQNLKIFTISHSRTLLPLIENQRFGYYLRKLYVAQYNVGFLILAAMPAAGYAYAVVALAIFWFCVPETKTGVNRKASHQKHLAKS